MKSYFLGQKLLHNKKILYGGIYMEMRIIEVINELMPYI